MRESFALRGARRYLKEKYLDGELPTVFQICEEIAEDLSRRKGYLHPRALAAATSHIHQMRQGKAVTLENTSSGFRISSATLREYLRTYPAVTSSETAKKMLQNSLFGQDLREALDTTEVLQAKLDERKNTVNPAALAAASVYVSYYRKGKDISLADVAKQYSISTSTLRDYVSSHEDVMDPANRAKTLLEKYASGDDLKQLHEIIDKIDRMLDISTPRIIAAIAYYLHTIDSQKYVTIEKVAREFNVSIPALRSYLEPYLASISQTYLLYKKGAAHDLRTVLARLNDQEMELLNKVYSSFGTNIFELSLLFDIGGVPRGRWQLFVRKIGKLGLLDIYKKPLDPKQYCALVGALREYLSKTESLNRWV